MTRNITAALQDKVWEQIHKRAGETAKGQGGGEGGGRGYNRRGKGEEIEREGRETQPIKPSPWPMNNFNQVFSKFFYPCSCKRTQASFAASYPLALRPFGCWLVSVAALP